MRVIFPVRDVSSKVHDTVGELSFWFLIGQYKVLKGSNQDDCF
jgi:hypothetical protein